VSFGDMLSCAETMLVFGTVSTGDMGWYCVARLVYVIPLKNVIFRMAGAMGEAG
jgi:hypothetical protein